MAVNPLENPDDPAGAPPNLAFLEILTEFTGKLLKQDKKVVLLGLANLYFYYNICLSGGSWLPGQESGWRDAQQPRGGLDPAAHVQEQPRTRGGRPGRGDWGDSGQEAVQQEEEEVR